MEDRYIPIADVGFYHAVPGYMDGQQAFRAAGTAPEHNDAQLIAKRLREWREEYFRFIEADLEPTNNPAELTTRQSVLDRVVTQGSRSIAGNE